MARHFLDPVFSISNGRPVCCVCSKPIISTLAKRVYLGSGCFEAITNDEPDFDGLIACVGPECSKSIPEQFFVK